MRRGLKRLTGEPASHSGRHGTLATVRLRDGEETERLVDSHCIGGGVELNSPNVGMMLLEFRAHCAPQFAPNALAQMAGSDEEQLHERGSRQKNDSKYLSIVLAHQTKRRVSDLRTQLVSLVLFDEVALSLRIPILGYVVVKASTHQ